MMGRSASGYRDCRVEYERVDRMWTEHQIWCVEKVRTLVTPWEISLKHTAGPAVAIAPI